MSKSRPNVADLNMIYSPKNGFVIYFGFKTWSNSYSVWTVQKKIEAEEITNVLLFDL